MSGRPREGLDPDDLRALVGRHTDTMVDLRRLLHRHPELSGEEVRTTAVIREAAASLGLTPERCPTPTGGVFSLTGGRPGRTVLVRADIDALPLEEEGPDGLVSAVPGVMHACGHDAHAAWLVGAAAVLADRAEQVPGRVIFFFQPAEEQISGARAAVDGNLLEDLDVDVVLGAHITSLGPVGAVATRAGVLMAGCDQFRLEVTGRGGHGALEVEQGNVVLAASRLVDRLATVVEGVSWDGAHGVCAAGVVRAGSASNVVPTRAEVLGTVRTFSAGQRAEALRRLDELASHIAAELGVTVSVELGGSAPPVRNDAAVTEQVLGAARRAVPGGGVVDLPVPVAASDDVSELLGRRIGCYLFVGGGLPDGSSGPHHSPSFRIDEGALAIGAGVLAAATAELAATARAVDGEPGTR